MNEERYITLGKWYCDIQCFKKDLMSFEAVQKEFGEGFSKFWVLVDEELNVIIGSIAIQEKSAELGELRRMFVSQEYRRQGLGSKLVDHLLNYAREHHVRHVHLTTPAVNIAGIKMYEQAGFIQQQVYHVEPVTGHELDIVEFRIFDLC